MSNDPNASEESADLMQAVYDELHALASSYLRRERSDHTLQTTALVNEAWLRLSGRGDATYENRAHFFRAAALAMRRILMHHAEKHQALKRGGGRRGMALDAVLDASAGIDENEVDLLAMNDALNRLAE